MDIGKHVFPTEKFRLVKESLVERGFLEEREIIVSPKASDEQLLRVLTEDYLADLRSYHHTALTRKSELPITREIVEAMAHTAGGTIVCVEKALAGGGAACHLGGGYHHAHAGHAEGFCYINDIAVGAAHALDCGLVDHLSVIDLDTHQGNGTAEIFRDVDEVYTASVHDETIYPKQKAVSNLDIGLPRDPGQAVYLEAVDRALHEAIDLYRPDLVIYAAGVDPYEQDILGRLRLSRQTLRERDRRVAQHCIDNAIPFVTVVSGGYARELQDTVSLHAQTVEVVLELLGFSAPPGLAEEAGKGKLP